MPVLQLDSCLYNGEGISERRGVDRSARMHLLVRRLLLCRRFVCSVSVAGDKRKELHSDPGRFKPVVE